MEYRRVEMLELHSAGVILTPREYNSAVTGWAEWPGTTGVYRLEHKALARLAAHLGLETKPYRNRWMHKGQERYSAEPLESFTPAVYREALHIGPGGEIFEEGNDSQQIEWLEVAAPAERGFLQFRVCLAMGDGETVTRELGYSGDYTVWWE